MVSPVAGLLLTSPAPEVREYELDGQKRTALVFAPKVKSEHPPLIFVFHGHGGNARQGARSMDMQTHWPEAVFVSGEGLPTKTPNDLAGQRNGWQIFPAQNGARDLKYFDAVYSDVSKSFSVDPKKVFAHGHSNGARFAYVLWAERGEKFRAFAASSAGGANLVNRAKPKPIFIIGGKTDAIVAYSTIEETVAAVKSLNGCKAKTTQPKGIERWKGNQNNDLATLLHEGGHAYRKDANAEIVKFWKSLP